MKSFFNYFTTQYAIKEHDFIITNSGGINGIKNLGLLESVLEHIKNETYYPDFEHKLTHLVFSIIKNHAFNDGNKRTSIALGAYFLELNYLDIKVTRFVRDMENIVVHVADNRIDKELLFQIIKSLLYQQEYSENLKLKIINVTKPEIEDKNSLEDIF